MKLRAISVLVAMAFGERAQKGITSYMQRTGLALNALAQTVDKLDAVPEAQRGWYVEKDGKFNLDLSKVDIEDTKGLKSALEKEREAAKAADKKLREQAEIYKDIDPVKYRELMAKLDGDDEGKLIAAGKIDEVVNRRTEKQRAQHEKDLKAEQDKAKAAETKAAKFSQRVLDNHIRAAGVKAGLHQHAIEDALFRARSMFSLDDAGDAVQLDSDGKPVMGKDGKKPFSPTEWLEDMKEKAPHWFPAGNSGGGGKGDKGAGGGGKDLSGLSPQQRMTEARANKK